MNTSSNKESQYEVVNPMQSMMVSTHEAANIVARAVEGMLKTSFELSAAKRAENLPGFAPSFLPEGSVRLLWQVPALYQVQSRRMMQVMLDSFAILSRAQQQLLGLDGLSLSSGLQKSSYAMADHGAALTSPKAAGKVVSMAEPRSTALVVEGAVPSIPTDATRQKSKVDESRRVAA